MTLPPARRLSRYVEPALDPKRVDRVWARIAARPFSARSPRGFAVPATAAAVGFALAAVLLLVVRGRSAPPVTPVAGLVLESAATQTMTLGDGSSASLWQDTRLRFDRIDPSRVETTVEQGEATFDVRHSEARLWMVHAGGFDVVDRGTRFVVTVRDGAVSVRVETGSVEVRRAGSSGDGRKLEGGESWTSAPVPSAPPPVEAPAPATSATAPSTTLSASAPSVPSAPPATLSPGPREILETANAARLAGHPREAAQAFDTIRTRFRTDARAGLAAFELGRLRLDALGDPTGAVAAFDDAILLAPNASFREDAEARRVEALDRIHDARCPTARQAFLARYPNGLHAASVAARCP